MPRSAIEHWLKQHYLLVTALFISFGLHGALVFAGSYRGTYDAFVHIFFADHYARSWWSLWEPRWYTGFTMASYPPLTHQLTALLSRVFSLPIGFSIVILASTMNTTLGVYRFSQLWVSRRAAGYAAIVTVFSSSIAETVHVFGQLPTIFVMGVLLNTLPYVWQWLEDGHIHDLLRGWALVMVAAAGHHVTTLFGMVFFSGPIFATVLLIKFRLPRADEPDLNGNGNVKISLKSVFQLTIRRAKRVGPAFVRSGVFGVGMIMIIVLTVLPYWMWSSSDPITQISIPHASRDSFLENDAAGFMFFVIPWGVLIVVLPYALIQGFLSKNWILTSSLALLALLGTGGTTPIPAFLLRAAFYILTLDRFTFWASIIILPYTGQLIEALLHGKMYTWVTRIITPWGHGLMLASMAVALIGFMLFTSNLTKFRKFQPAPVDIVPMVEFMEKDNHDQWRYLTLGFGDQMAWFSANTTALNVEGNYHSARRLPEMTSTPVERLDGAKFTSIPGLGSLQQFLTNPQRYNLKYVFVNDAFYEPLLFFSGWHKLGALDNGIDVWERSDVPPLPAAIPAQDYPEWQRFMWGATPVSSIAVTFVIFSLTLLIHPKPGKWIIIRWFVRRKFFQQWLVDNPMSEEHREASKEWQLWRKIIDRLPKWKPRLWQLRVACAGILIGSISMSFAISLQVREDYLVGPEAIILAYYDDLDFKRFSASYDYLVTDVSRESYLRWLSLQGGLLASFAKLDNLDIELTEESDTRLHASVEAEWVTSLGVYTETNTYMLEKTSDGWRIVFDIIPPPIPRETFVSVAEGSYTFDTLPPSLDRSALTRGVLDRSLLQVSDTRVVFVPHEPISFIPDDTGPDAGRLEEYRFSGLISVIGYVVNRDPYPSHVTVTAILRDEDGNRIAETNVRDVMIHQLLPGESTPFRVDFSGVYATEILSIETIASVDLIVKGVPTAYNLERPLVVQSDGMLFNTGTVGVDIPHMLSTYYDDAGNLLWINSYYLELGLSVDESEPFEIPPLPEDLTTLNIPIESEGPRLITIDHFDTPQDFWVHGYMQ